MADEPVSAWREPFARRARRWAKRNRTAVTGRGGGAGRRGGRAVGGAGGADAGQGRGRPGAGRETRRQPALAAANDELDRSKAAVQARYDLAVEAIKTFHTGVSEDFLLKQEQFKELRDRLLKSAAGLLRQARRPCWARRRTSASRRALAASNFELAELTGKVGPHGGRAGGAPVGAGGAGGAGGRAGGRRRGDGRRRPEPDRRRRAAGGDRAGRTRRWRRTGGRSRCWRAWRAPTRRRGPRWRPAGRGWAALLSRHGPDRRGAGGLPAGAGRPGGAGRGPRGLGRGPPRPGGHGQPDRHPAGGDGPAGGGGGRVPPGAGDPAEAGRRQPRRHRIPQRPGGQPQQPRHPAVGRRAGRRRRRPSTARRWRSAEKLADDNPAVTEFRSSLATSHNNLGSLLAQTGKPAEAEAEYRTALAIQQKLADDNPAVTEFRSRLADSHNNLGVLLSETGRRRRRRPSTAGAGDPAEAGRRQPRRHRLPQRPGAQPQQPRRLLARRASRRRRRPSTARRWRSRRSWPTTTPPSPTSQPPGGQPHNLGILLAGSGQPAEAEAEYRTALAIYRKLADDNPAVTDFRSRLADSHHNLGILLSRIGPAGGGGGRVPPGAGDLTEAGRRQPRRHRFRSGLAEMQGVSAGSY